MYAQKWHLVLINILGGIAVLGSYIYGFLSQPDAAKILWGGIPESLRPFYTTGMLLAAAGYFAFTYFIFFRLTPRDTHVYNRLGVRIFNILYSAILIPSALWLPLTFLAAEQASAGLLWVVRIVLAIVGLASVGLLLALLSVKPHQSSWAYKIAIIGSVFFCIQTAILDAIIWGSLVRV
jgi:hypothetical protein